MLYVEIPRGHFEPMHDGDDGDDDDVGVLLFPFFPTLQFLCFSVLVVVSRTLCNAYESTESGEVPLRFRIFRTQLRFEKQRTCERH